MKLLDIYSYLIANWLNGGNFVRRNKMQAVDICPEYNQIFTKSKVKKVFRITGIKPDNADISFIDYIRDQMFLLSPNVSVTIMIQNHPTKIDVNHDRFVRAMNKASEAYSSYKDAFDSQTGLAKLTGKTYRLPGGGRLRLSKEKLDDLYQIFLSYHTLYSHVSSGGTVALTEIFIELSAAEQNEVKDAGENLQAILGPLNIGCEEIRGLLKTYMLQFGLAMPAPMQMHKKFLPQLLFTDYNSAAFTSYKSRGLVGGSGLLLGMDFRSRLPLSIDIFRSPAAQVFMLMGKTGSGKTFAAFQIAMSALALNQYVTAIDIKGREWSRIAHLVPSKILTFDDRNPSFVNTLRLDDVVINDDKDAAELFGTAVKGTVNLLSLIVNLGPGEGSINDLELVLREAVMKLYTMNGVDPGNPKSFVKTAGMTYSDVLPILEELATAKSYTQDQKRMVQLARSRCHAYIGSAGIFSEAFKNEISLSDVLNTPLVIYEFNKNQGAMTDSLDVIRIFMVQFLDSKKKAMLRAKNRFLFCFYEELQRCDQFGNLLEYICADVTGSRSNNAVIILLLNSLKVLQGERARDIRSNITSFFCGLVEDNDITTIAEEFGQPWLASQLTLIRKNVNAYRNCFAAVVDTGAEVYQTMYKVVLPDWLSDRFKTRTTKEDMQAVQAPSFDKDA